MENNPMKELRKKYDRVILSLFLIGLALIITAVALHFINGNPQMFLALASVAFFLGGMITMFMKSFFTGKKYAVGAKKRRKKYLNVVYGENSILSNQHVKP
jgi:uncharacterized integral membrane protein